MKRHVAAAAVWTLLVTGLFAGQAPPQRDTLPLPPRDTRAAEVRPEVGRAVIRGQILAADTGRPLPRATITASASLAGGGTHRAAISTNAEGRYDLVGLPAGRYGVSVRRDGYLPLAYGQRFPRDRVATIDLADSAVVDLDFRLPRMSVVSGRITDELGEPIANAFVSVVEPGRRSAQPPRSVPTDADGQYRVAGLEPGTYVVVASSNETWRSPDPGDAASVGYARTYFPGAFSAASATRVTLGIGQEVVNMSFSLVAARLATITGTAFTSTGAPLQGLMLMTEEFTSAGGAVLSADGTFRVTNVRPGRYILRGGARSELVTMPLEINGADVEGVSIRSGPGWSLSGRVIVDPASRTSLELTRVTIHTDIDMQAITGAFNRTFSTRLQPAVSGSGFLQPTTREGVLVIGPSTAPGAPATARADRDGKFQVTPIFGPSEIAVSLPPGWVTSAIAAGDRNLMGAVLELPSGAELSNVDIVVTDRTGALSGRVVDDMGAPLTRGTVIVFSEDQARWRPWTGAVRETQSDSEGAFRIDSLPAGRYAIAAVDFVENGRWFDPEYLRALLPRAARVDVAVDAQVAGISLRIAR